MKKNTFIGFLLVILLSTIPFSTFAEKVECKTGDYPVISWITNPKILQDDLEIMEAELFLQFGSCEAGTALISPIHRKAKVVIWDDKPFKAWKKQPFTYKVKIIRACTLRVRITFNKDVMFKKRSHKEAQLQFFPLGKDATKFEWIINIDEISDLETSIELDD